MKTTIINYLEGMNEMTSNISSIGSFVSQLHRDAAQRVRCEIMSNLSKDSTAYKIISKADYSVFSYPQLSLIADELMSNESFVSRIVSEADYNRRKYEQKIQESKNKKIANKSASADFLKQVKDAGKKLADYYLFVKSNKKYAKEFYSKKFSQESVSIFLNLNKN